MAGARKTSGAVNEYQGANGNEARSAQALGSGVVIGSMAAAAPAVAQKPDGILHAGHFDSPASMSILEESTLAAKRPVMGVFNNLVMFDQQVAQNSPQSIVPDLATLRFLHATAIFRCMGRPSHVRATWLPCVSIGECGSAQLFRSLRRSAQKDLWLHATAQQGGVAASPCGL